MVASMSKSPKEKAALRQDKLLSHTTKRKTSIEQARAHLFGVCLLDASYIQYLPACVHFSEYGAFTIAMIKHGMGLEAIIKHLEAYGLTNAHDMLTGALIGVSENINLSYLFIDALTVISCHE
jgi:hypothetical protein